MNFLSVSDKQGKLFPVLLGLVITGLIGIVDFLTGYEIAFSVFYVIPVAIVTWCTGREFGLLTSLASAVVWFWADAGHVYSYPLIPVWNSIIRLAFFVIITLLLSALRKSMARERALARTDNLTGAINSRFFYELTQMELDRFHRYRHPFTIAYIDLDNFKAVNDRYGHPEGDRVLRIVVSSAGKHLRKTDVLARLGGDEFALLLSETDEDSACAAVSKVRDVLLAEMQKGNWPVTFSIGVLTCRAAPQTTGELMKMADELMYSVKRDKKNAIRCATYSG